MTGAITAPGLYDLAPAAYHADPCPEPSLSSGIAKLLVRRSPLHAFHAHPRFTTPEDDASETMDAGSIVHRLMLGAGADFEAVAADDWRTKAAREAADAIRAAGRIPVLARKLDALRAAAEAALFQMRQHPDCDAFFGPGRSEAVAVARDGGAWLRCMVDRMPADPAAPWFDIKTTSLSAAPVDFQRAMIRDHAFQAAFYLRIGRLLGLRPAGFFFVAVEQKAPHGVAVLTPAPSLMEIAAAEVERAVVLWRRCVTRAEWPGYPQRTAYVEAPGWATAAEELAALEEEETA